jgi:MoxR-vWA-beta-propeller ternary system domain bpX2
MTPRWQDVRCASIPVDDLSALADLRREPGIRVTIADGRAWVCWDDEPGPSAESEATRRILVTRLLPRPGVEIFARSGGRWHRPGEHLPTFGVPVGDGSTGSSLDRVIVPAPMSVVRPGSDAPVPVPLRIVRDADGRPRPAAALRCRLSGLAGWAERAPSSWIESISGAWCPGPTRGGPGEAEVLLLGSAARLPAPADGLRYWGADVLIPIGYRAEPDLAQRALRGAVGAGPDVLVVLDADGPELVPRQAFQPMSRAGIRRALAGVPSGRTTEEARS